MSTSPAAETLLDVQDLRLTFPTEDGDVRVVDGVTFDIRRGEVFCVVGESGSGKSVTAMTILGLLPDVRVDGGHIEWRGENLIDAPESRMKQIRGNEIAMIFQDPLTALNPVHTVGRQIAEVARHHQGVSKKDAMKRAIETLDLVGIPEPAKRAKMYPHEYSGGMRQRAMIAMAISCTPDLLIADEPTTALDVTVQAQVLEALVEIKDEIDSAIMLITHDLGVVAGLADRVMVMYAGRQAEVGTVDEVFHGARHPYTMGLLGSIPRLDSHKGERLIPIPGTPPSLLHRPPGCAFHPRCGFAEAGTCDAQIPRLRVVDGLGHEAACHRAELVAESDLEDLRRRVAEMEGDAR